MVDYRSQLGAVDPQIVQVGNEIGNACQAALGRAPKVVWGWGPNPEHNNKRCIDFMVYGDREMGQWISDYVVLNAERMGLLHIIWWRQIWSVARRSEGWRDMEDRGDPTQNHEDHPHVNFENLSTYIAPDGSTPTPGEAPIPGGSAGENPTYPDGSSLPASDITHIQAVDNGLMFHYQDGSSEHVPHAANGRYLPPRKARAAVTPEGVGAPGFDLADSGGGYSITADMIEAAVAAVGGTLPARGGTAAEIAGQFNQAIESTVPGILSHRNRVANLIGQCAQETGGFNYLAEIGGSSARYAPYYGRGYIQLTWADNYRAFGAWLKTFGAVTDDATFYRNPDQVATTTWAAFTAIYYFTKSVWGGKTLWQWCDEASDPWSTISRAINRGSPTSSYPAYHESVRTAAVNAVLRVTPAEPPVDPTGPGATSGPFGQDVPYRTRELFYGYPGGQCTAFACWRVRQHTRVTNFHNWWHGPNFGNANTWDAAARQTGVPVLTTPKAGTVAQSNAGPYGHVAWVTKVHADGTFDVEENNWAVVEGYGVRRNVRVGTSKGQFENFIDFDAYTGSI